MGYDYDKAGAYFKIFSGGWKLDDSYMDRITRVTIDASTFLPRSCEIEMLGEYSLEPGQDIAVFAYADGDYFGDVLFKGMVVTNEVHVDEGNGIRSVVRAYDPARDMLTGARTRLFEDMTYSEVIKEVGKPYGLAPTFFGAIKTSPTKLPTIVQMNETDWDFVCRLAREMGWVLYAEHYIDLLRKAKTRLSFGPPGPAKKASSTSTGRKGFEVGDGRVISLKSTITGAGLPTSVEVPGWDGAKEQSARATMSLGARQFVMSKADAGPDDYSSARAGSFTSVERMASSNSEARMLASGMALRYASSTVDIEMLVRGHPAVQLNEGISIRSRSENEGKFTVSAYVHEFTPEFGFQTMVYCTGYEDRSISGLQGAASRRPVLTGVYPAIVNSIEDPKKSGRVTLTLPWLDSSFVTGWARVMQMGAGKGVGWQVLPAPKDEVLVAFENGQLETPYVLGGIGGKDGKVAPTELMKDGSPVKQVLTTKSGHQVTFDDSDDESGITIQTSGGKTCIIKLSDKEGISITTAGDGNISITSGGDVSVTAKKTATVNAQDAQVTTKGDVTVKATGKVDVAGSSVTVDATSSAKITGATVTIEASGPLNLKGAMVNIQ